MDVVEDAAARQLHLPAKEGNAGPGQVRAVVPRTTFRFAGPRAGAPHAGLVFSFLKEDAIPGSSRALRL